MTSFISNEEHYSLVTQKIASVKENLWIGTADIKDLYVNQSKKSIPFLEVLSNLVEKGVEIRLIHAKEPGKAFREDFDKYKNLIDGIERVLCPRVHFKIIVFDLKLVYVGSANLTGAGLGMKSVNKRNFESGILSSDKEIVKSAINQFDNLWMGKFCKDCQRKDFCPEPLL